jgi:hypothetical protein
VHLAGKMSFCGFAILFTGFSWICRVVILTKDHGSFLCILPVRSRLFLLYRVEALKNKITPVINEKIFKGSPFFQNPDGKIKKVKNLPGPSEKFSKNFFKKFFIKNFIKIQTKTDGEYLHRLCKISASMP